MGFNIHNLYYIVYGLVLYPAHGTVWWFQIRPPEMDSIVDDGCWMIYFKSNSYHAGHGLGLINGDYLILNMDMDIMDPQWLFLTNERKFNA